MSGQGSAHSRVLIATVTFLANSVPAWGSSWSVLRGSKFLIFYYESEFNSSFSPVIVLYHFGIVLPSAHTGAGPAAPLPFPASALACLFMFPACNSTQCVSRTFWKHRKVVSCIRVKSLCIFGVHRLTLTSQWLHNVPCLTGVTQ